jgi:hypothetical protein
LLEDLAGGAADASWLPAELAGWLLEASPDAVQALGAAGQLPAVVRDGRRRFAARPCLERWGAAMFGRVLYPGDPAVRDALAGLARAGPGVVREAAQASRARIEHAAGSE